ncbi:MAG: hypothetical protein AAGI23_20045 [Bacteroidota bacterium]
MDVQMDLAGSAFATRKSYLRSIRAVMLHDQCLPENCTANQIKAFLVYQHN